MAVLNRRHLRNLLFFHTYPYFYRNEITHIDEQTAIKWAETTYKLYLLFSYFLICIHRRATLELKKIGDNPYIEFTYKEALAGIDEDIFIRELLNSKEFENAFKSYRIESYVDDEIADLLYRFTVARFIRIENTPKKRLRQWKNIIKAFLVEKDFYEILIEMEPQWSIDVVPAAVSFFKTLENFADGNPLSPLDIVPEDTPLLWLIKIHNTLVDNFNTIRDFVSSTLIEWSYERLFIADKLIIMLGIAEKMAFPSQPTPIVISEYLSIIPFFSSEDAIPLVNGVLDTIFKKWEIREISSDINTQDNLY